MADAQLVSSGSLPVEAIFAQPRLAELGSSRRHRAHARSTPAVFAAPALAPLRGQAGPEPVLVVEDDRDTRQALCRILSGAGLTVQAVADGGAGHGGPG